MTRSQSRKTATARKDVAVSSSLLPVDMNAMSAENETIDAVAQVGNETVVQPPQPWLCVAAKRHDLVGLPQKPTSHPDEQQRRDGLSGEVGGRDEREREGEGEVGGALEAKLDDGEAQEVKPP